VVPRVPHELESARDFYFDLIAQVRMERYTRGQVALLGDAAYSPSPVTGLGASLALVGAYVLAGELAQSSGTHQVAFTRYEAAMRGYVKLCQELPPFGLAGMLPRTRRSIWMRNLSMRMMTRWPVRNLVAAQFHKADAMALEDYLTAAPLVASAIRILV
jgi:2-polyprenyl-6-methoxyphenol hydroxylase-like FAD-dependent oxidoreductase